MTTGELLDSKSTVSNTTALIHLQNINQIGGDIQWFPYTDVKVIFTSPQLIANFSTPTTEVAFTSPVVSAEVTTEVLSVTFEDDVNDISLTC